MQRVADNALHLPRSRMRQLLFAVGQPENRDERGEDQSRTDHPDWVGRHVPVGHCPPDDSALDRNQRPDDRHEPACALGVLRLMEVTGEVHARTLLRCGEDDCAFLGQGDAWFAPTRQRGVPGRSVRPRAAALPRPASARESCGSLGTRRPRRVNESIASRNAATRASRPQVAAQAISCSRDR